MRKLIIYLLIIFVSTVTQAQDNKNKIFSFKAILLNTEYSDFPSKYKNNCDSPRVDKPFFCIENIQVGEIPMDVEFYFKNNKLQHIEAYFPREKFNLVILSLAEKYGKQNTWDFQKDKYVWYSSDPDLENSIPDELTALHTADSIPISSISKAVHKIPLSVIRYESMQSIRENAIKRESKQKNDIKNISDDL